MNEKQAIIDAIIAIEWNMFQQVSNIGGRASCQDQPVTFRRMREGQYRAWSAPVCQLVLENLREAQKNGRNLVAEKYARMMASTDPGYYREIRDRLPVLSQEVKELARSISFMVAEQSAVLRKQYPLTVSHNRPIFSEEDIYGATSLETYLRGELMTYSLETLQELQTYAKDLETQGKTLGREMMEETLRESGYTSLDETEAMLQKQQQ